MEQTKEPLKVLFVDDRVREVLSLWGQSGVESRHSMLPFEPFRTVERTLQLVREHQPNVVLIGFGLSVEDVTGADVALALQTSGYAGYIVANSGAGGGIFAHRGVSLEHSIDRKSHKLSALLEQLSR